MLVQLRTEHRVWKIYENALISCVVLVFVFKNPSCPHKAGFPRIYYKETVLTSVCLKSSTRNRKSMINYSKLFQVDFQGASSRKASSLAISFLKAIPGEESFRYTSKKKPLSALCSNTLRSVAGAGEKYVKSEGNRHSAREEFKQRQQHVQRHQKSTNLLKFHALSSPKHGMFWCTGIRAKSSVSMVLQHFWMYKRPCRYYLYR